MGVRPGKSTKTKQDDCLSTLHTCGHMIAFLAHSQACIWNTAIPHGSPHHTLLHSVVICFGAVGQSYFLSLVCVSHCKDRVLLLYSWSYYRTSCTRVGTTGPLFLLGCIVSTCSIYDHTHTPGKSCSRRTKYMSNCVHQ